jgi:hypothetical protein
MHLSINDAIMHQGPNLPAVERRELVDLMAFLFLVQGWSRTCNGTLRPRKTNSSGVSWLMLRRT